MTGFEPMHVPARQVSVCVHAFASLQALPSGTEGFEQPVDGSHVPALWHWSKAVQVTGFEPMHVPARQVSVCVHAFASLQALPSGNTGFEQRPVIESHFPAPWQLSRGTHTSGVPLTHTFDMHLSTAVHALPSLQAVPSGWPGQIPGIPPDSQNAPEPLTCLMNR